MMSRIPLLFKTLRLTASAWIFTLVVSASSSGLTQTLDEAYSLGTSGPIQVIAVQPDGKVLAGGDFDSVESVRRSRLARFCANGTLDPGFYVPASGGPTNALTVNAVVVQRDGKIVIGGEFTMLGAQSRNRIARVFPNGSPDLDFNPGADGVVNCFALQSDGKILVGGKAQQQW